MPQIIPLFPQGIKTFVDLFGGGGNVTVNVNAEHVIYNDILKQVPELLNYLQTNVVAKSLSQIKELIATYDLSKTNQEGYLKLREDYNDNPSPIKFYTLICYAFNNQIRFNSKGEYNMPFGKNRSSFNPSLEEKFIKFTTEIQSGKYKFQSGSFEKFNFDLLSSGDFVYCDPPYYNSLATYNESGGWTEGNEKTLLHILDTLTDRNIKWALSNNLKYDNQILDKWKERYNVRYLNGDYSNCNYQKKDKSKDIEVLITNY